MFKLSTDSLLYGYKNDKPLSNFGQGLLMTCSILPAPTAQADMPRNETAGCLTGTTPRRVGILFDNRTRCNRGNRQLAEDRLDRNRPQKSGSALRKVRENGIDPGIETARILD